MSSRPAPSNVRAKLLDAAVALIRRKGFSATSIDDLCVAAGVTKGAFFHHFASKEALGVAVATLWGEIGKGLGAGLTGDTARDRVFAYLDLRTALLTGGTDEFTCLAGTLAQEVHQSHPAIRDAAGRAIADTAATIVPDIAQMLADHSVTDVDAMDLALHIQAVLQGGFILAKARGGPEAARDSVRHLRRYISLLIEQEES